MATGSPRSRSPEIFEVHAIEGKSDFWLAACPALHSRGQVCAWGRKRRARPIPEALRLIAECQPDAVMIENVKGLLGRNFADYRSMLRRKLTRLDYSCAWKIVDSSDFGIAQTRLRSVLVGFRRDLNITIGGDPGTSPTFTWPAGRARKRTVGGVLKREMSRDGWPLAADWARVANAPGPALVGGSKKHGGPDLGPTQSKRRWAELGIDAHVLADAPPGPDWIGPPRLTVQMAGLLQGFPARWPFSGGKTAAYRQVGNAFPASSCSCTRPGDCRCSSSGLSRIPSPTCGRHGCRYLGSTGSADRTETALAFLSSKGVNNGANAFIQLLFDFKIPEPKYLPARCTQGGGCDSVPFLCASDF